MNIDQWVISVQEACDEIGIGVSNEQVMVLAKAMMGSAEIIHEMDCYQHRGNSRDYEALYEKALVDLGNCRRELDSAKNDIMTYKNSVARRNKVSADSVYIEYDQVMVEI